MQNAKLQRAHTETQGALKKVTGLNENLRHSINEIEAIINTNESAKTP
jgi:hypothetical protein